MSTIMNDITACSAAMESWDAAYRAGSPETNYRGFFGPGDETLEVAGGEVVPIQESSDPSAPVVYARWSFEGDILQEGPTGDKTSDLVRGGPMVFMAVRQPGAGLGHSGQIVDNFMDHMQATDLNTAAVTFVPQATEFEVDDRDDNDWPSVTARVPYSSG